MQKIIEKCRTTRILATIGTIGLVLGTIMPYVKFNIFGYKLSVSLVKEWEGKIIMILAIANLLFIFKDMVEKYIPSLFNNELGRKIKEWNNPKYSLVLTILIAIFAISGTTQLGAESFKYYNIGFYSLWIGVICLVAYAMLYKNEDFNMNLQK